MTDWPSGISTFRTHENLPQQVYDPLDLKTFFAEDLQRIEAQLVAVENSIGVGLEKIYPVGSLYFNADVTTNPATLLGFGTWAVFGEGRVPVGKASSGTFGTLGGTMGNETHTLTIGEMPAHAHRPAGYYETVYVKPSGGSGLVSGGDNYHGQAYEETKGGGGAHNNIQPSIVVCIWKRTA
jgi:hypothetical protein